MPTVEAQDSDPQDGPDSSPLATPRTIAARLGWDSEDRAFAAVLAEAKQCGAALDGYQQRVLRRILASSRLGVYLSGPVGRGKTWLMDVLLTAASARTARMHLHAFFRSLSRRMHSSALSFANAVDAAASGYSAILIDEFHLHDVADAAMLRRSLSILKTLDVAVFTTSNTAPDQAHPDPMIAEAMAPAASHIHEFLEVLSLDHSRDYRRASNHTEGFAGGTWNIDPSIVGSVSLEPPTHQVSLPGTGRTLRAYLSHSGTLDTTWDELCEGRISAADLVALTECFTTWRLRALPQPSAMSRDGLQRFAQLIDVLADAELPLHAYAVTPPGALSHAPSLPLYSARMFSRLQLMEVFEASAIVSRHGIYPSRTP